MSEKFECAWCGDPVYRNGAKVRRNTTGIYFCGLGHRDLYLKKNGPLQKLTRISAKFCKDRACENLVSVNRDKKRGTRRNVCSISGVKPCVMKSCPLDEERTDLSGSK